MVNDNISYRNVLFVFFCAVVLLVIAASPSLAGTAIGWEGETILEKIAESLSGPIARNLAIICLVVGIGGLAMQGIDFASWGSRLSWLFLGISVFCFAKSWLDKLGVSGSLIF